MPALDDMGMRDGVSYSQEFAISDIKLFIDDVEQPNNDYCGDFVFFFTVSYDT